MGSFMSSIEINMEKIHTLSQWKQIYFKRYLKLNGGFNCQQGAAETEGMIFEVCRSICHSLVLRLSYAIRNVIEEARAVHSLQVKSTHPSINRSDLKGGKKLIIWGTNSTQINPDPYVTGRYGTQTSLTHLYFELSDISRQVIFSSACFLHERQTIWNQIQQEMKVRYISNPLFLLFIIYSKLGTTKQHPPTPLHLVFGCWPLFH